MGYKKEDYTFKDSPPKKEIKNCNCWSAWVAQLVKHPTLDFTSGLDLRVMGSSPVLGSTLGMEPTFKKE